MFQHILIPTDGSELSRKAVAGALDFAKTLGARLTAYTCLEEYPRRSRSASKRRRAWSSKTWKTPPSAPASRATPT